MYAETYGTDWTSLTPAQAYRRAFALGVAEALGERLGGEYERILAQVGSTYEKSVVELAYEEGERRVRDRERTSGADDEAVWSGAVRAWRDEFVDVPSASSLPPVLRRLALLDPPGDDLGRLRLPALLLRR